MTRWPFSPESRWSKSMVDVTGYSPAFRLTVMSQFIRWLSCLFRISSRARVTVFQGSFSVPFAESLPSGATQKLLQSTAPAGCALNWIAATVTRAAATTPAPTLSAVRLVFLDISDGSSLRGSGAGVAVLAAPALVLEAGLLGQGVVVAQRRAFVDPAAAELLPRVMLGSRLYDGLRALPRYDDSTVVVGDDQVTGQRQYAAHRHRDVVRPWEQLGLGRVVRGGAGGPDRKS